MIYLDNAATTYPKPEEVYNTMDKISRESAVNAGRGSYRLAREMSALISETKLKLRELIHADISTPVIFSPSITVAMNQIVFGLDIKEGSTLYLSPYEHNAVARSVNALSNKKKITVKEIPINTETLEIDIDQLKYEFSKNKPGVVFCTHISNVTGYILPVEKIFAEAKKYNAITVLDTAQSLGLLEINVNALGADIIAFTGHKSLYGPFGIGGFINVGHVYLDIFISGGTGSDSLNLDMPEGEESKYEAASSNIIAIAGLMTALININGGDRYAHKKTLTKYLIDGLSQIKEVKVYKMKNPDNQIGIISFVIKGFKSEDIGIILDEDYDIAVRTGYHCAPYIHKYMEDEKYGGTVRVGLGQFNTENDIDKLIDALKSLL